MSSIFESYIFEDLDPYFVNKIKHTVSLIGSKPDVEVIGTFMALYNEANENGVTLSKEQQKALFLYLRDELPEEKRQKFDLLISMMNG